MVWYDPINLFMGLVFIVSVIVLVVFLVQSDKEEQERKNRPPEEDYIDHRFSEGGKYEGDTPEQRTIHRVAAQEQLARYREMEHGLYD
tara:strand:- start:959 stop:1222 length:264 start_codon:yes stop_codon:yes gene_type:complete